MTKTGHLIIAGLVSYHLSLNPIPALFGAVLPDKDVIWGWNRKKKTLWNAHRGFTHHLFLIPLLFALYYFLYPEPLFLSFVVGYTSHLVMDAMTPLGLPYRLSYYPRFSLNIYKTGSWKEWVIVGCVASFVVLGDSDLKEVAAEVVRNIRHLIL